MSEEFKAKLQKYSEGTLPEEERGELESELAKLEAYQAYLEELMEREELAAGAWKKAPQGNGKAPGLKKADKREKRIIRRGKWKARITNTFTVLSAFLIFAVISSIITAVFYSTGNRGDIYRDVVSSAIAVARPNTTVRLSSDAHFFFRMDLTGNLMKQIGGESSDVGDYSQQFRLGLSGLGNFNWTDERNAGNYFFYYPAADGSVSGGDDSAEWSKLTKLPEGTVAEAYLSFDHLYTTDELLKEFEPLNILPVWFGVDTGSANNRNGVVTSPLGFPYQPIWHDDDMLKSEVTTQKTGWFSSVSSYSSMSPSVESYGSGDLRDANFLKTLKLLEEHRTLARKAVPFIELDGSVAYLAEHGVRIYGAVATGPVKELLKLREASWVSNLRVGEVRLWNWRD
ncbi:anti-sigma factor [Paenibacillus sp. MMS20-IR301]|uniref:anti-sigma factor n=1 Tax=Paenibacillus sp. MMS20-IR301 TaxID=2895946 RepID=UPI0028E2732D|nr:anti-sigma factor [Paenibacillus sp. MMS20-IR301]WNS40969.1 anti-sigma factor [Paenibacillus sp. MMS20-IR301]